MAKGYKQNERVDYWINLRGIIPGQEHKVFKLTKSLYELKQAPKQWHEKFDKALLTHGFMINESDKCVYSECVDESCVIICLNVDDILNFGSDLIIINDSKSVLCSKFDMKDMGEADVILEIIIEKYSNGIIFIQSQYIEKILRNFDQFEGYDVSTPFDHIVKLSKNKGNSASQQDYSRAIGCLTYITNCTRPDIAYAVSKLSRYTSNPTSNPTDEHWMAMRGVHGSN